MRHLQRPCVRVQAFDVADSEGEVEFRAVQLIAGGDGFTFLAEDADDINALREFAGELQVWGAMAGGAKNGSHLYAMLSDGAYLNRDLDFGFRLVDLEGGNVTLDLVTLESTMRTMASVSMSPTQLQCLGEAFEQLIDKEASWDAMVVT